MIPLYKEDCKWYDYWQDMGARIPFCKAGKNIDKSGFVLETCDGCKDYGNKNVTTNADRFRAMSDEELAIAFAKLDNRGPVVFEMAIQSYRGEAVNKWLEWLKQECTDG